MTVPGLTRSALGSWRTAAARGVARPRWLEGALRDIALPFVVTRLVLASVGVSPSPRCPSLPSCRPRGPAPSSCRCSMRSRAGTGSVPGHRQQRLSLLTTLPGGVLPALRPGARGRRGGRPSLRPGLGDRRPHRLERGAAGRGRHAGRPLPARLRREDGIACRVVPAAVPHQLFLSAVYADSLFLALSLGAVLMARRDRWLLAGRWAGWQR